MSDKTAVQTISREVRCPLFNGHDPSETTRQVPTLQEYKAYLLGALHAGKIHNPSVRVDPDYWRIFVFAKSHWKFAKQINSWRPKKKKRLEERNMI